MWGQNLTLFETICSGLLVFLSEKLFEQFEIVMPKWLLQNSCLGGFVLTGIILLIQFGSDIVVNLYWVH